MTSNRLCLVSPSGRATLSPARILLLVMALGLGMLAAPAAAQNTPTGAPDLVVKGSDTIGGSLGPALARAFEERNPGLEIEWEGLGSSSAFVGLFDGSADLGASSRSVRESELEEAERLGLRLQEYVLGYDGIAVLVHPSNPVEALSVDQIRALFTGTLDNWNQVGGPNLPVTLISRPSYSGTHGFFRSTVLEDEEFSSATRFVEHSEDIARLVADDPAAVAYLGMGWIGPGTKPLRVAARVGEPAVTASVETVRTGSYPIYRPLLLYTRGEPAGLLRDLLQFVLAGDGQNLVRAEGFIPSDTPSPLNRRSRRAQTDEDRGTVEVLRVSFGSGGTRLDAEARRLLDRIAERLLGGGVRALLVGHADSEGTATQNRRISEARARTVATYLRQRGVPGELLTVEGRGDEQPVATNETRSGRQQNRRVDVRILER